MTRTELPPKDFYMAHFLSGSSGFFIYNFNCFFREIHLLHIDFEVKLERVSIRYENKVIKKDIIITIYLDYDRDTKELMYHHYGVKLSSWCKRYTYEENNEIEELFRKKYKDTIEENINEICTTYKKLPPAELILCTV
jgi:hypothetical protein